MLFAYPVGRRAVLRAKCLLSCGITAGAACISNLLSIGVIHVFAKVFRAVPEWEGWNFTVQILAASVFLGVSSSSVGMVAALAGWRKGSGVAAVVCSVLLVCCTANFVSVAPKQIAGVMAVFGCMSAAAAGVAYHLLAHGIEQMEV